MIFRRLIDFFVADLEISHQAQVAQKETELQHLQSTVLETTQANQSLTNEQTNLTATVQAHVTTITELQRNVQETLEVTALLQKQLSEQQSINEGCSKMIEDQKETITKNSVESEALLIKQAALEESFKELEAANNNLTGSVLIEKESQIHELNLATTALTEKLKELSNQRSILENDVIGRDQQIGENEILINELQGKFRELTASNDELKKDLSDFKSSLHSKDDIVVGLNQSLKEVEASVIAKQAEIEALKAAQLAKDNQNEVISNERNILQKQLSELQQMQEETVLSLAKVTEKLADSENQKQSDDFKINDLSRDIEGLHKEIENLSTENNQFKDKLSATISALEVAQTDIAHKNDAINDNRLQIEKVQQNHSSKVSDLDKAHKTIEEVTQKLASSTSAAALVQDTLSHLEVEHEDLKRKMVITEQKSEALAQERTSLQHNLEALQCSSSDTNSEIRRLTEELQLKQKTYDEMVDKSNGTQLTLERKLHEVSQNLAARTTQWERVKEEIETLTTQKIDRENELNLELSKIKEASEAEREALANEIKTLRASFNEEKERLARDIEDKLKEAELVRIEINDRVKQLESNVVGLQNDIELGRNELQDKEKELIEKIKAFEEVECGLRKKITEAKEVEMKLLNSLDESSKSDDEARLALVAQLTEYQKLLNEQNLKVAEISSQLEERVSELQSSQTQFLELSVERESLKTTAEAETARLTSVISELEAKLSTLTDQFRITEDDQVDLVNKNLEMIETLTLVRQQLSEADERNQITEESAAKLQIEHESIKTAFDALKTELESSIQNSQATTLEKDQIIHSLDEKLKELTIALQANTTQLNGMEHTLHTHQDAYEAYKTEVQSMQIAEMAKVQLLSDETLAKQKTITALEDKITQLTSSVNLSDDLKNELNNKSEELRSKDSSIAELNGSIVELQQKLQTREIDFKRIADERQADSQRSLDSLQERSIEINHLQEKIESLERSLQTQSEHTSNSLSEAAAIMNEKEKLTKENSDLNELIAAQQQEFQNRMTQYEERSKFEALQAELELLEEVKRQEVEELMQKLKATEQQMLKHSAGIERLDAMQRKEKDLIYQKTALERREKELMDENKHLTEKLNNLKVGFDKWKLVCQLVFKMS